VFSAECFPTVNEAAGQVDCENKLIMAPATARKIAGELEKHLGVIDQQQLFLGLHSTLLITVTAIYTFMDTLRANCH
jgi:hypothetical protein